MPAHSLLTSVKFQARIFVLNLFYTMAKVTSKSKPSKVAKKPEPESDSESSSSSSSSSSSESESDSSDSEDEKPLKAEKKAESDDSDSDSDSSSSSDSDSDSDDEEEEKKAEEKKADSDSDSESDDEDSDDEKTEDKKETAEADSDSDSSSSSSSSDSSSDSESDSDDEKKDTKRKAEPEAEVEEPSSKKQKVEEESAEEGATLFVGRLSWSVDDDWLKSEFESVGGVVSARVMMERATGKSRGYGYVDFSSKAAAEKALAEMQGKEIDGRPINLDMSTGKPRPSNAASNDRAKKFGDVPSAPSDTLFVGNLSFNAERSKLYDIFGEYGNVISCRIPTHPDTQQPKGFGYVQFSSIDEAKAAYEALNGEYLDGRACRLDYSTPRDNNSPRPSGGRGGRGGRGGSRGGFGGRERSATPTPGTGPNSAPFRGTKKTFD